jgi:hypothetical protein
MADNQTALTELRTTIDHLLVARQSALKAELQLDGARLARCVELTDEISDAISQCWRLSVVVEGDCRASQAELRP